MKKITLIFALLLVLSVSGLADDGDIHTGGRSIVPDQKVETSESPILIDIIDFLNSIFG